MNLKFFKNLDLGTQEVKVSKQKNDNSLKPENDKEYEYSGEIEFLHESLNISRNRIGWNDAFSQFYINKDGSGKEITAWGTNIYEKGTLSAAYEKAKEIYSQTHTNRFSDEEIEAIFNEIDKK